MLACRAGQGEGGIHNIYSTRTYGLCAVVCIAIAGALLLTGPCDSSESSSRDGKLLPFPTQEPLLTAPFPYLHLISLTLLPHRLVQPRSCPKYPRPPLLHTCFANSAIIDLGPHPTTATPRPGRPASAGYVRPPITAAASGLPAYVGSPPAAPSAAGPAPPRVTWRWNFTSGPPPCAAHYRQVRAAAGCDLEECCGSCQSWACGGGSARNRRSAWACVVNPRRS